MKILFFGDVVGSAGRRAIAETLPAWRKQYKPDLVLANAENATHGMGVTPGSLDELMAAGVEAFTVGDHFFKKDFAPVESYPVVRPANLAANQAGVGARLITTTKGQKVLLLSLLGRAFLRHQARNYFQVADELLELPEAAEADAIFLDFHAEATSEKNALARYLDGRVTAVVGTHTHVPTADTRLLPAGTAFQTDVGMCGALESVIGFEISNSYTFLRRELGEDIPKQPPLPAADPPFTCDAVLVEANGPKSAQKITRLSLRP